jgi:MFS family permease
MKDKPLIDVTIEEEDKDPDSEANSGAQIDDKKRDRSKILSIIEGSLNSISMGFSENYISAFAIALGSSNFMIALLSSLPKLIAAIFQLGVLKIKSFFKSRRTFMVVFSLLQALMWLPMMFVPDLQHPSLWLLLFVTMAAVCSMLISPIWNSYMGDLVEENSRGQFFGKRNMFTGLFAFVATLLAGWILQSVPLKHALFGFMILFGLAFVTRVMATYFTSKMIDIPEETLDNKEPDVEEFVKEAQKTPLGIFTTFLVLFYIAVYLASPFFAVYELSILHFSYLTYTIVAAVSAISSFIAMLVWGKYVDKIGSRNILVICGFLIPIVPFVWSITSNLWVLLCIETFSGIVWAGFNLSVSTYLFDMTDKADRTRKIAVYTLFIQAAVFVGAMLGSLFLLGFDQSSAATYKTIFLLSAILRMVFIIIFFKKLHEMRIIEIPLKGRVYNRMVSVTPRHGIVYEPSIENKRNAGLLASESSKQVSEEVQDFAQHARGEKMHQSSMKRLEKEEDDADSAAFLKKSHRDDGDDGFKMDSSSNREQGHLSERKKDSKDSFEQAVRRQKKL